METNNTQLNLEQGNLPTWADEQAKRISKLKTFQPKGWTAVGYARATKSIKNALRSAGMRGPQLDVVMFDIVDLARLYAITA
jgi:hypothetical protein